jgi:hypothetical protein
MNVDDDAATYLLCTSARRRYHGLYVEHVVESRLLALKSLLGLVKLVEACMLPLAVVLTLQRFAASGNVRSGLTFHRAIVRVGGVHRIRLLLEEETLMPRVVGCRHLPAGSRALGLVAARLRSLRGDWPCVSRGVGSFRPTAGEPHLSLRVHGVVAEPKFVLGQHLLRYPEHEHGGGERCEAEELQGLVRA